MFIFFLWLQVLASGLARVAIPHCPSVMILGMLTDPYTIKHYNEHAEDYDRHVSNPNDSTFHSFYEKPAIKAELPNLKGFEIISIGCGSGVDAKWLADNGYYGVEM